MTNDGKPGQPKLKAHCIIVAYFMAQVFGFTSGVEGYNICKICVQILGDYTKKLLFSNNIHFFQSHFSLVSLLVSLNHCHQVTHIACLKGQRPQGDFSSTINTKSPISRLGTLRCHFCLLVSFFIAEVFILAVVTLQSLKIALCFIVALDSQ